MDSGEVQKRLRAALATGKRAAAERRVRSDEAAKDYEEFLTRRAVPVCQQVAAALTGDGHPFRVMTPSGSVRLTPEGSSDEFIEISLDSSLDPPEVIARIVRGRGRRGVESERPLRDRTAVADLTEEHVLDFLVREIVPFVQRP